MRHERLTVPASTPTRAAPVLRRRHACRHGGADGCRCCAGQAPDSVRSTVRQSGEPLDTATRDYFAPRFGHSLANIRIHADAPARASAADVHARAYTVGSHIVLGPSAPRPHEDGGRRLMAHELAHAVAQRDWDGAAPLPIGDAHAAEEQRADAVAAGVASPAHSAQPASIRRQLAGDAGVGDEHDDEEVHDGDQPVSASGSARAADDTHAPADAGVRADAGTSAKKAKDDAPTGKDATKPKAPVKKWITDIDVNLASQVMTLHWSDGTTTTRNVSTGKGRPDTADDPCKTQKEHNCTPPGDYAVSTLGDGNTKNSHGDHMSWYVGFIDARGIGIHNSQPVFKGTPASHGCVRVGAGGEADRFAKMINQNVVVGKTMVHVAGKAPTKAWSKGGGKKKSAPKPKPKPKSKPKKKHP